MRLFKNGVEVDRFVPTYSGEKIAIAIDSSKSNTAIAVGNVYGEIFDDYEIDGSGSDVDVYQLCWDTRKQLKSLFTDSEILAVGIEDIITPDKGKGLEIHQSRAKITAVFDNLIFLFQDIAGFTPRRIPNQVWKAGVLPAKYRKQDGKKGSKQWFDEIGNRWADRKDDVTDVVCIYMFMMKDTDIAPVYTIKETVPTSKGYEVCLVPSKHKFPRDTKRFIIKNSDTLEHNIATMVERLEVSQLGIVTVPIEQIPIDWIYSEKLKRLPNCVYDRFTKDLTICVCRGKD